jgi:hypothetical protein
VQVYADAQAATEKVSMLSLPSLLRRWFALPAPVPRPAQPLKETRFAVGQAWTYVGAPTPDSRVVIGAIDIEPHGRIFSIGISGVLFRDKQTGNTVQNDIFHAPLDEASLDRSVIALDGVSAAPPEGFADGYAQWQHDREHEGAGFFTITVAEIIALYGGVLNR